MFKLSFKEKLKRSFNFPIPIKFLWISTILFILLLIGMTFNFLTVVTNQGLMPVKTNLEVNSDFHFGYQDNYEVNYWYLSDIIYFNIPFTDVSIIMSIGDILIYFSLFCLILLFDFLLIYLRDKMSITKFK